MFSIIKLIRKSFLQNIRIEFSNGEDFSVFDHDSDGKVEKDELKLLLDRIKEVKGVNSSLEQRIQILKDNLGAHSNLVYSLEREDTKNMFSKIQSQHEKDFTLIKEKYHSKKQNIINETSNVLSSNIKFINNFDLGIDINNPSKVRKLQSILKAEGYVGKNGGPLSVDGLWGPNTKHALLMAKRNLLVRDDDKQDYYYTDRNVSNTDKNVLKENTPENIESGGIKVNLDPNYENLLSKLLKTQKGSVKIGSFIFEGKEVDINVDHKPVFNVHKRSRRYNDIYTNKLVFDTKRGDGLNDVSIKLDKDDLSNIESAIVRGIKVKFLRENASDDSIPSINIAGSSSEMNSDKFQSERTKAYVRPASLDKESHDSANMDNFLKGLNYKELGELYKLIKNNNVDSSDVKDILEDKYGYDPDGWFGSSEYETVSSLILDRYETQAKIPNMSPRDRVKMLFDFDKNGNLQVDKNFNVGELQMDFHTFKSLTSDGAEALMKNLGLGSIDSFSKEMQTNLFSAREKFKRVLAVHLQRGIKPSELVKVNGIEKANDRIYENKEEAIAEIGKRIDNYVHTRLKGFEGVDTTALKLEAVGLLIGPGSLGAGASFNIKQLDLFFESLQVGLVDGIPGISISKNILEKNGFNVTWSQLYLVIPALSGSYTTKAQIENFSEMYQQRVDDEYAFSANASISPIVGNIGISGMRIDGQTSSGIEQMASQMSRLLNQTSIDLKAGKSFEESKFYSQSKNKELDAKVYAEMKNTYDQYAKGKPYSDAFLKDMMNGYLGYYENKLYSNAEGTKVTSIGAGFALLAGFMPLPYLLIGGEHISTDWEGVLHSIDRERSISSTNIDMSKLGIKKTIFNGHKVLVIPNGYNYNISNLNGSTQAQDNGKDLFISGDLSNFNIDEHTTHSGVTRTIVLNGGVKDENGLYIPTNKVNIRDSVESLTMSSREIVSYNAEAISNTATIRKNLFNIIQTDALNHKSTIGLQKLQRMVFDYKNDGATSYLLSVWLQFKDVINHPGFAEYAEEKGAIKDLNQLRDSIQYVKTDYEKVLIVQSIASNLMKKDSLQDIDNDGNVEVNGSKQTISEYDKQRKRAEFFDKEFAKEFPDLLPEIRRAREDWYKANGDAVEYIFKPVSDGSIAFTGVSSKTSSGRENVRGVMNYTGAYNIASTLSVDFIDIEGKSPGVINNLPNKFLENIKGALNANGANLSSIEDTKKFINAGGGNGIEIDYSLAFCKMSECLNDAVVLRDFTIKKEGKDLKIGATSTSEVYSPSHDVLSWGVAFTDELKDRDSDKKSSGDGEESTTTGTEGGGDNGGGGVGGLNDSGRG